MSSKGAAGAAGAAVTGVVTWLSGALTGVATWAFSTEQVWFALVTTYQQMIAPQFDALPDLGPWFLGLIVLYAAARIAQLWRGGNDEG